MVAGGAPFAFPNDLIAVDKNLERRSPEAEHSPAHGPERGVQDIDFVDFTGPGKPDSPSQSLASHEGSECCPLAGGKLFRVVQPR